MTVALETENLTKVYKTETRDIRAVDDLTLEVAEGEFIALVGPSGSGKTTALAMLAGLLTPTEGKVRIGGDELQQLDESERTRFRREKIGFTFQDNNLVSYLNALENVELILRLNGTLSKETRERAKNLLERLGLGERLHNYPDELSGGQQQRVAIARSLVHKPSVVLADEPTASLDTERAYQVVETFADLIHEQEGAGIMVTHDLRMCLYVDRVIEMIDGKMERVITDREEIRAFAQATDDQAAEATKTESA